MNRQQKRQKEREEKSPWKDIPMGSGEKDPHEDHYFYIENVKRWIRKELCPRCHAGKPEYDEMMKKAGFEYKHESCNFTAENQKCTCPNDFLTR